MSLDLIYTNALGYETVSYHHNFLLPSSQLYILFGDLIKSVTMGQEAKDLKLKDAKIFRTNSGTTGVAVLTNSNRFAKNHTI